MSYFLVKKGGKVEHLDKSAISYLVLLGSIVLLVFAEPDLGTATSLALTIALMLFLGGLRFRYYLGGFLVAAPLFYFLVLRAEYRRGRILAFLDPASDPYGLGYQIRQSLTAVGSGGLTGVGLAQGSQKLFYLPEPHTDFIFAVIGEEVGLLGCLTILLLFVALFWRGIRVSLRADTLFGTYLGLGIISVIVFQAFFNISVVLSLCPTKGIPLPFISVGGSSMLVMLAAAGILLNISKHARRENLTELKS
jgi:cell division protein FtsW